MIKITEIIKDSEISKLKSRDQPEWLEPMLATLTHNEFSDKDWIYERKLDGERCLAFKNGDDLRLLSRNFIIQKLLIKSHSN